MNRELMTELIERYLDGDMSPVEKAAFEERIENDALFRKEYDLHIQVRNSFTWEMERRSLKAIMKDADRELHGTPSIQRNQGYRSSASSNRRIILLAASVSLLITAGSLVVYNFIQQEQVRSSQYATLNRTVHPPSEATPSAAVVTDETPKTESQESASVATAFAIHEEGWFLTNHHVVRGKKYVYLEKMADTLQRYVAEVVAYDSKLDIALVHITDPSFIKLPQIPYVVAEENTQIGQKVFTLGYPKDDIVYSEGPVSSLTGYRSDTLALQLSLPVNPGNSGAPLFSENGELIGILTGKNLEADAAAYGLKSSYLRAFINECAEYPHSLPKRNQLKGKKITEQVRRIDAYVYMVKS